MQISKNLIDTFALQKEFPVNSEDFNKFKNYFTDKRYENYPVVGITQNVARLYCLWRTTMQNKTMKLKGLSYVQDYRLLQDTEWLYVADICKASEEKNSAGIQKVSSGKSNKLVLCFLFGNVAEWTANSDNTKAYARGGSWKDTSGSEFRRMLEKEASAGYIGFRIIRSSLGKSK